jgi:hypothetical protein
MEGMTHLQTTVTQYKGASIRHVHKGSSISITAAVDHNLKIEYEGPICVDHLTNSYRYGEEAHLLTYQQEEPKAIFRYAESRDWYRVELHFKLEQLDALALDWLRYRGIIP